MKRLLRFISDYTSLCVLLALCVIYSYVTLDQQHPTTAAAGAALGKRVENESAGAAVVIFTRDTAGDAKFAEAIESALKTVTVVERVAGSPRDIAVALRKLGESETAVDYVLTHHPGSTAGPLQPELLGATRAKYPALTKLQVVSPPSYYWPSFLTRANLLNVINRNADIAIIAIGMTLVIISGGIDLSVGSVLAVSAVMTAFVLQWLGGANASLVAMAVSAIGGVVAAAVLGGFTGATTTFFRVPSFVVTLSMMMVARGAAFMIAGSPDGITVQSTTFSTMANGNLLSIPNPIWVMVILYAVAYVVMSRTAIGRYVYAVGGNAEAARLSGVPVSFVRIMVFAVCGALSGLCGVIHASRFETGLPGAGELYELQVIAAVVVGGASLSGGSGTIIGTLIGAMILAVIENGLNMAHVGTYEKMVVFGVLILAAVLLDKVKLRRA